MPAELVSYSRTSQIFVGRFGKIKKDLQLLTILRSNRFRSTQNALKHQNSWSAWKIDPKQVLKKNFFLIQFSVEMVKNLQFKWSGKKLSSVCAEFYAEHFCQCMSSAKMLPVENIFSPDIRTSGHPHIRTSGHHVSKILMTFKIR